MTFVTRGDRAKPLSIVICDDAGKGKHNPYVALGFDVRKAIMGLHNGQSIAELARSSGVHGGHGRLDRKAEIEPACARL